MAELTPKENYLRLAKGEVPDYVPIYMIYGIPFDGVLTTKAVSPNIFNIKYSGPEGGTNLWGVKYVASESTAYQSMPEPNNFILDDVTKWDKVVKAPKMPDGIDWEAMAKKDIEASGIDRTQTAMLSASQFAPFQSLMAFMGFNEGLMAMFEEPEAVKELFNYMADFYLPIIEKTLDYYKPDIYNMGDDTAAKQNPFVSVEMYRDLLKPIYERLAKPANDRGIPIQFHNCGRCEDFLDDMVGFGVKYWDPAQTSNNLLAVKEKYKGKLAFCGSWDWVIPDTWPVVDEEQVRQSIRDAIDLYAPGGGYAVAANPLGEYGDTVMPMVDRWVKEEMISYGRDFYKKSR